MFVYLSNFCASPWHVLPQKLPGCSCHAGRLQPGRAHNGVGFRRAGGAGTTGTPVATGTPAATGGPFSAASLHSRLQYLLLFAAGLAQTPQRLSVQLRLQKMELPLAA